MIFSIIAVRFFAYIKMIVPSDTNFRKILPIGIWIFFFLVEGVDIFVAIKSNLMSVIKLPLLYEGTQGEKHLLTLFDSGANLSCIRPDVIEGLEKPISIGVVKRLQTADAGKCIEVSERVTLDFYVDNVLLSDEFLIVPGLSEDVVMGAATLQKWRIRLDFEHDQVLVNPRVAKLRL